MKSPDRLTVTKLLEFFKKDKKKVIAEEEKRILEKERNKEQVLFFLRSYSLLASSPEWQKNTIYQAIDRQLTFLPPNSKVIWGVFNSVRNILKNHPERFCIYSPLLELLQQIITTKRIWEESSSAIDIPVVDSDENEIIGADALLQSGPQDKLYALIQSLLEEVGQKYEQTRV